MKSARATLSCAASIAPSVSVRVGLCLLLTLVAVDCLLEFAISMSFQLPWIYFPRSVSGFDWLLPTKRDRFTRFHFVKTDLQLF
jgi:hypothetical protein